MRSLKVTGSYKGLTGHDHHTRSIVRALHQAGVEIQLFDLPQWSPAKLPPHMQDQWFEQLNQEVDGADHLYFCMPHQVQPASGTRIVNYTMFEADRIPDLWVRHGERHDLIVVPTNSCRQAWIDSGAAEDKIAICSLGVDIELFSQEAQPLSLSAPSGRSILDYGLRFLNVADVIERKNIFGLLRAWLMATDKEDDAALILKPGFYVQGARERFFKRVHDLEITCGKKLTDAAQIFWIEGILAPEVVPRLYASATHYISASRGEGFDLPMLEAGVSGLQLIAPRHTSYLDYLTDDIAHLIPAKAVRAMLPDDPATGEFFAGAHWWEPDQEALCEKLRAIIDGEAEAKRSARDTLIKLSWSETGKRLEQLIFCK